MSALNIGLLYALFAVVATVINLGAQRLVLSQGDGVVIFAAAVFLGTVAGLVAKYLLDKRWIFADTDTGLANHSRKFGLYSAMGLVTTAIFWGAETAFWLIFSTETMRELGAVLGLSIGYIVKYFLDRRFVFTPASV
ncbi:polysaccharide biosynthesis protein GtrA [Thioclava sp. SK-1]|uniref:GtrA family protein n=1 Tax=Thioclava sp. SK-1 TaxID=1889770 RepID=UPI000824F059|nr:GtrA family protein [Thioclava sp. SK-1]OCX66639.1 polysaccharide biosynthesis protein GtrA [Thioclava sp. SK-1]